MGNPPFHVWQGENRQVRLGTFAEAAAHGEVIVNATNGMASLDVLRQAGAANLEGKILIDVSNPLDSPRGCRRRSPSPIATHWASRSKGPFQGSRS